MAMTKMKYPLARVVAHSCLIACCGTALLVHTSILLKGSFRGVEDNKAIAVIEFVMAVIAFLFAWYLVVQFLRSLA